MNVDDRELEERLDDYFRSRDELVDPEPRWDDLAARLGEVRPDVGRRALFVGVAAAAVVVLVAGVALVRSGRDTRVDTVATAPTVGPVRFGDMASPCGPAPDGNSVTVSASEGGRGTDRLFIGVPNDRTSTIRPGMGEQFWSSAQSFTRWCNAQGGIDGLQIALVDLDGKLLDVGAAMGVACSDTFAMVGGMFAQDDQMVEPFDACGLIAVPSGVVSQRVADDARVFSPTPTAFDQFPRSMFDALVATHGNAMANTVFVTMDVPALTERANRMARGAATVPSVGVAGAPITYPVTDVPEWSSVVAQVKQRGATAVGFLGEPAAAAQLSTALRADGWSGIVFGDESLYSPSLTNYPAPDAAEGIVARTEVHPLEEADRWPAVKQVAALSEPADLGPLDLHAWSAWLLFATAADRCVSHGSGELSRACVLETLGSIHSWTGGGLHAETDPASRAPAWCSALLEVHDGAFRRIDPLTDDEKGFRCAPKS